MKKTLGVQLLTILITLLISADLYAQCATTVSGTIVNQTWTKSNSPYCVDGDILIAGLTIEPGVRVEFLGNYVFEVAGVLTAVGNEQEQIIFTSEENNTAGWQGLFFNYSNEGSRLSYCTLEGAKNSGIRIVNSIPNIDNCEILNNSASQGGGMNINLSGLAAGEEVMIRESMITGNTSSGHGGGIRANLGQATLLLEGCTIDNNVSNPGQSNSNFVGGGIYSNTGSGLFLLSNCVIMSNRSNSRCASNGCSVTNRGGGIYNSGNMGLENCIVNKNRSWAIDGASGGRENNYSYGGGIYQNTGMLTVTNCIISHNEGNPGGTNPSPLGSGMYVNGGSAEVQNCTIAKNKNEGIRRSGGTVTVINSIIYFNDGSEIVGTVGVTYSDIQGGYAGEGNIDIHPIFEDEETNLQIVLGSRCIDAGNPDPQYNDICFPPSLGTDRNDMGAHGGLGGCYWNGGPPPPDIIAKAGPDQNICQELCDEIILDGSQSSVTYGEIADYDWKYKSTSDDVYSNLGNGESIVLSSSSFMVDTYDVLLTVTDDNGLTATDEMVLVITESCYGCDVAKGDLDYDGDVDGDDLKIFSQYYGTVLTP